ncbi:unnamed protein product [Calypogeia fissa]
MERALSFEACAPHMTSVRRVQKPSSVCHLETAYPCRSLRTFADISAGATLWSIGPLSKRALARRYLRGLCATPFVGPKAKTSRFSSVFIAKSMEVDNSQTTEEKLASLVAANEKLLARLAELEATIDQFKAEGFIPGVKKADSVTPTLEPEEQSGQAADISNLESVKKTLVNGKIVVDLAKVTNMEWPSPDDEVPFWKRKRLNKIVMDSTTERDPSGVGIGTSGVIDPVYVVHITAEMAPIAKVGGLGDVVTGLGRACLAMGHKVLVMLPYYECLNSQEVQGLREVDSFSSFHRGSWIPVKAFEGKVAGVPVLLIQPSNQFFKGPAIYGGAYDEMEAYLFFCRATLEKLQISGEQPDIIHIHEWQIGAVAMLYWDMYHHLSLKKPRIILTIHNMEHYGECRVEQISMCGLDGSAYSSIDKAVDERTIGHNPERLSLLKGGIVYSNAVTTVSPTYANETLCSGWLANTLLKHRAKYSGILNGIDTVLWDPSNDPFLPMGFSAKNLFGKQVCKQYVQRGLGLQPDDFSGDRNVSSQGRRSPLAICITRLVAQKGIHLIRHAINQIGERGGQFVLLGTAPDPRVQAEFEALSRQLADSKNIRLLLFYSEELAHMLYAAGDIVLVPSMFEPCGLTQMIGMRYGAIPLVRRTGGLADTVFDVDDNSKADLANGFVFDGITEQAFDSALNRALSYYQQRPEWWQNLTSQAMEVDYSWNKSAQEYVGLYNSVRV